MTKPATKTSKRQAGQAPDPITDSEANLVNNTRKPPTKQPSPDTSTKPPDTNPKTKPPDPAAKSKPPDPAPPGQSHRGDTSAAQDSGEPKQDDQESEHSEYEYVQLANDPDPIAKGASAAEKREHVRAIRRYSDETLAALVRNDVKGESLWLDFMTAFRPHTIRTWGRATLIDWTEFLIRQGVFVDKGRHISKTQALTNVLYREQHIPPNPSQVTTRPMQANSMTPSYQTPPAKVEMNPSETYSRPPTTHDAGGPSPNDHIHPDRRSKIFNHSGQSSQVEGHAGTRDGTKKEEDQSYHDDNRQEEPHDPAEPRDPPWPSKHQSAAPPSDPSDPDDDEGSDSGRPTRQNGRGGGLRGYQRETTPGRGEQQRRLGINGLMRAFNNKSQFSGGWDEDLDNTIGVFSTLATMCQLTPEEKVMAIPVMLAGDALSYYSNQAREEDTFESAMGALRAWYNSDEKKARTLTKWQTMTLSEAFEADPESSEAAVFRTFVAKLTSLQKQLDTPYHTDNFLRDRLLTAVDLPAIQSTLRDRMPQTSQMAVNRVANQLSDKPGSAGSNPSVNYSLGKSYHGDAKRQHRKPWMRGRNNNGTWKGGHRLSPRWMRGIKGCFVCGKDHNANTKHPPDEVTAAINKLKAKHPQALLTVEDLAAVVEMTTTDEQRQEEEQGDDPVWLDEEEESDSDDYDANVAMDETEALTTLTNEAAEELEVCLANVATAHGMCFTSGMETALAAAKTFFPTRQAAEFQGITVDTGANRRSIICKTQLLAYQRDFKQNVQIEPSMRNKMRGIGGTGTILGEATLPVPFSELGLVLHIAFVVLERDCPTLLSNKDMLDNGLDISIQDRYISMGERRQPLILENYFLKYKWDPYCMIYAAYSEKELVKIHRSFGHPSVRATYNLLRRAGRAEPKGETLRQLEKIAAACRECQKNEAKPRRFKLTVGTDELTFNHIVVIDTMFINSRPVLHLVDESTHFTSACFLKSQTAEQVWKAIMKLWILTYMGPPDHLSIDQGSNYISKEFEDNATAAGITILKAPIENPGTIGLVERYHAPLRRAFDTIRATFTRAEASDDECLHMAVYANNVTIGPEGLCPMLLVFGALPKPLRTSTSPNQLTRQKAIEEASKAVQAEQSKRRLSFALRHPTSNRNRRNSELLRNLPAGSPVLVYRTTNEKWDGPHKFVSIEGETAVVQLPHGRRIFRSHCVKPLIVPEMATPHEHSDGQGKAQRSEQKNVGDDQVESTEAKPTAGDSKDTNDLTTPASTNSEGVKTRSRTRRETARNGTAERSGASTENESSTNMAEANGADKSDGDAENRVETEGLEAASGVNDNLPGNRRQRRKMDSLYRKWNKKRPKGMAELGTVDLGTTPRKVKVKKGSPEERAFAESRKRELDGLVKDGTFVPVPREEVPDGHRIFGSRFVDELKRVGLELIKKSRLIAQNYADEEAVAIASSAPTVQRFSQRVLMSIAAAFPELRPFTRDITQAYVQAHTRLERLVFITAPSEMGLPEGYVLKVVKPLYGIPESGLHWYLTYLNHHLQTLGMKRSKVDPCVLYRRTGQKLEGIIVLQVDDSLGAGMETFLNEESQASKAFRCKERTPVNETPVVFNGISIRKEGHAYTMTQSEKIDKLKPPGNDKEYASSRALAQYIGVCTRPDVCSSVQLLVPQKEGVTAEQTKKLTKVFSHMAGTREQGLNYTSIDMTTARIALMTDASFANAPGGKSQLGYIITLMDKAGRCNILHYGSNRCQRVCRSVMAAEMHGLILGFDYAYIIQDMLQEILGTKYEIEVMTDSRTLFNVVTKDAMTTERRLQIDILQVRESYDNGEIRKMAWIPGLMNPADPLTKYIVSTTSPLYVMMQHNRFKAEPKGYAESHENRTA